MTLIACVCALTLGASAAPALAVTYPDYYGSFSSSADGSGVSAYDAVHYAPTDTHELRLVRNGAVIASNSDPYPSIGLPAGGLQPGDQAVLLANGAQVATFSYDGTPTIGADACAGATQFTGSAGAGTLSVSAYTPSIGSGTHHNVAIARTSSGFAATADAPLLNGDRVSVDLENTVGDVYTDSYTQRTIGDCPASAPPADQGGGQQQTPPATTPPGPTPAVVLAGLTTSLTRTVKLVTDVPARQILTAGGVNVPVRFFSAGTYGFVWQATPPAHSAAAAKTITVAKGSLTRSTPGTGKVKVGLTNAGKKLLRRSRSLKITIRGTFKPVNGAAQVATKKATIKRRVKKKH